MQVSGHEPIVQVGSSVVTGYCLDIDHDPHRTSNDVSVKSAQGPERKFWAPILRKSVKTAE